MNVLFAAQTDVGLQRQENEDNYLVDSDMNLYVVCDGMGGHVGGRIASSLSVNTVHKELVQFQKQLQEFGSPQSTVTRKDILTMVRGAIQQTCYKVYQRAQRKVEERGMGTTLSLLLFAGGRAFIGHVGDSRVYLVRGGTLHQLTEDHSLINEMLRAGRITEDDDVDPRFRNAVTRAVGVHETVDVDTLDLELLPGDRFIICSDGLYRYGEPETLLNFVTKAKDEDDAVNNLINFANENGGADNITAIAIRVVDVPQVQAEDIRLKLDTFRALALFKYLSYNELLKVLNLTRERSAKKGEHIFSEGDQENCTYVILRGRVQIRKSNAIIAILTEGHHFGEMALVDNEPRSAAAIALEDSWLIEVPRARFFELMRKNPGLAVKLLWSFVKALTVRLRHTNNELSVVKTQFQTVKLSGLDDTISEWLTADEASGPLPYIPTAAMNAATEPQDPNDDTP